MNAADQSLSIKQTLNEQLRLIHSRQAISAVPITRIEIKIDPIDIFDWLIAQSHSKKIYWSNRESGFEMGAVGVCDLIIGHGSIDYKKIFDRLHSNFSNDNPNIRYYGGFCFDAQNMDAQWNPFGTYQFFIPRFEIFNDDGQMLFVCNVKPTETGASIIKEFDALIIDPVANTTVLKSPVSRHDFPKATVWKQSCQQAITDIDNQQYQKIVLARKSVFEFNQAVNAFHLKKHLKKLTPECYHFCFQTQPGATFLGASPERLYKRDHQAIESEAIAGTRRRGKTVEEDVQLQDDLKSSRKELHEHQLVVNAIETTLRKYCHTVTIDQAPQTLSLIGLSHLKTRMKGTLKNIGDDQLIESLHPTPAVAGYPKKESVERIRQLESFSRGWYAGLFGHISCDTTELTVAIRSGLIEDQTISLYAGAGLTSESNADCEWDEIENKMNHFFNVFNVTHEK